MHDLIWSPRATADLAAITDYIAERNPDAAERLNQQIHHVVERLATFPFIHRHGRLRGTREAVVTPNCLVVYRVGSDVVTILTVLHARQRYP